MSSKTQQEYLNQLKGDRSPNHTYKVAPKLAYEWVKTGKLKQATFLEYIRWLINNS